MRKDIRIVNPASDHGFTSLKRALRFLRQGRAEWVEHGVSIRFIKGDRKHLLAQQSVNATRSTRATASCRTSRGAARPRQSAGWDWTSPVAEVSEVFAPA
ncbi:MAG: hypothetical protein HYZ57_02760 [Acidobacteria bacterium]|nr:hypothetical protein [Acidobacteriota bacterium]MBI3278743.1 hypothetical protein [Acidobacteriota bacterium]